MNNSEMKSEMYIRFVLILFEGVEIGSELVLMLDTLAEIGSELVLMLDT